MGSGVVNVTKGAVGGTIGLGVGAVKLVGTTSYAVVAKVGGEMVPFVNCTTIHGSYLNKELYLQF